MAKSKKVDNPQICTSPEQTHPMGDEHLQQLVQGMQDNLQHANSVISQTLLQSQSLMQQVLSNKNQLSEQAQQAASPAAQPHSPAQGVNSVQNAVEQAANHEQGMLGQLQQLAQQHLQQGTAPTDKQGYLGAVSNALHGGMDQSGLQQMQQTANQHIQNAEQAMQHSLNNIHQVVENQRKVFEQQFAQPQGSEAPAPAPQADGEQAE